MLVPRWKAEQRASSSLVQCYWIHIKLCVLLSFSELWFWGVFLMKSARTKRVCLWVTQVMYRHHWKDAAACDSECLVSVKKSLFGTKRLYCFFYIDALWRSRRAVSLIHTYTVTVRRRLNNGCVGVFRRACWFIDGGWNDHKRWWRGRKEKTLMRFLDNNRHLIHLKWKI